MFLAICLTVYARKTVDNFGGWHKGNFLVKQFSFIIFRSFYVIFHYIFFISIKKAMDENKSNASIKGSMKNARQKSLTPAVLGVANSHGIKLPLKMTSGNQKELLSKLEEWRKARREKLAASILAKQKQIEKSKTQIPNLSLKSKLVPLGDDKSSKIKSRESVFERLYKNSGKTKKTEVMDNFAKPSQISVSNITTCAVLPSEKANKSVKVLPVRTEKNESLHAVLKNEKQAALEIFMENHDLDSVDNVMETENQINEDNSVGFCKENSSEILKATKPVICLKSDQISSENLKSVKNDLDFKSLLFKESSKAVEVEKQKYPLRRSISMMFRQKCKVDFGVRRSFSTKNLNEINLNSQKSYHSTLRIPSRSSHDCNKKTKNEVSAKSVSFVTPKNNRSTSIHLRTKLEDWLKINGHALEGYRHLRCFDISKSYKSFARDSAFSSEHSLENSHYLTAPNTPVDDSDKENLTPPTVVQQVDEKEVENWLKELHRLIVELKYPSERCEEWLTAIRKKCSSCSQLPVYWECLAALHESKGDLKSAIEDYERAIIKGGEVDAVGNSLAELFDKLVIEQKKNSKRKLEKGLDPKNIFKSTIIKFALQQKALKKLSSEIEPSVRQQLYIATPVRRSTRIQTPFKKTEVNSLQALTPELLKNLKFKPNESLLNGN